MDYIIIGPLTDPVYRDVTKTFKTTITRKLKRKKLTEPAAQIFSLLPFHVHNLTPSHAMNIQFGWEAACTQREEISVWHSVYRDVSRTLKFTLIKYYWLFLLRYPKKAENEGN